MCRRIMRMKRSQGWMKKGNTADKSEEKKIGNRKNDHE